MKLSNRITGINAGGSDGWETYVLACEMEEAGTEITHLTIGEHDIRTDPLILEAMYNAALDGHTGYTALGNGSVGLRVRIAERVEKTTGIPTSPDNVFVVPGGQAGLFATHMGCCDPGDRAMFIDPYYATYPGTIRSVSAEPVPVPARPERIFQPDPADLEAAAAAAGGVSSLLINSPNNPTGVLYSRETMEGIARFCQDQDIWLISDEVYETQVWTGAHLSPRMLPGMQERTLVVGSMSKSHAMTGSRIGWVIGPQEVLERLDDLATNTTYGVAGFVQEAAAFALGLGESFEEKIAEPFRRRRGIVMRLVEGQNHVRAIPADGAMYVMLDIRATGLSGEDFANGLLRTHHVAVMPGESFGRAAAGHIRVALTVADDRLEEAVRQLLAYAGDLAARRTD